MAEFGLLVLQDVAYDRTVRYTGFAYKAHARRIFGNCATNVSPCGRAAGGLVHVEFACAGEYGEVEVRTIACHLDCGNGIGCVNPARAECLPGRTVKVLGHDGSAVLEVGDYGLVRDGLEYRGRCHLGRFEYGVLGFGIAGGEVAPCLAEVYLAADFLGAVPGVERLRHVFCGTVAVVEADGHGVLAGTADKRRVELERTGVERTVAVALVVVIVNVAEVPPEVLHAGVTDGAERGILAAPFRCIEVVGLSAVEGLVATPWVHRIGCGNHAHRRYLDDMDLRGVAELGLGTRFLGGDDAVDVPAVHGKAAFAVVVETRAVRVVVVAGNVTFERGVLLGVEAFPGEPADSLPYVVHAGIEFKLFACADIDFLILHVDDRRFCREDDIHGIRCRIAVIVCYAGNAVERGDGGRCLPYGIELRDGLPACRDFGRCSAAPFAFHDFARVVGVVVGGCI